MMMVNPRRTSHPNPINNHTSETLTSSLSSLIFFLKRPHAFPFLLSIFLLFTWLSLRLQHSSLFSSPPNRIAFKTLDHDTDANLVRFSSHFFTDKRGWLLNPVSAAANASISGGAVSCASVHVGEIRPGGVRGNHRHHGCNETFIIWGAKTAFRLENHRVAEKGYAEVIISANEVAVAASPSRTAHALINIDPIRMTFFMGCQDSIINYNNSSTDFKVACNNEVYGSSTNQYWAIKRDVVIHFQVLQLPCKILDKNCKILEDKMERLKSREQDVNTELEYAQYQ